MAECESCDDECKRRTRCEHCGLLVCAWCYHHEHGPMAQALADAAEARRALQPPPPPPAKE